MVSYTKQYVDYDIVDDKKVPLSEASARFVLVIPFKLRYRESPKPVADFVYALTKAIMRKMNYSTIIVLDSSLYASRGELEGVVAPLLKGDQHDKYCIVDYQFEKKRFFKRLPEAIVLTASPNTINNLLDRFWTHGKYDEFSLIRENPIWCFQSYASKAIHLPPIQVKISFCVDHCWPFAAMMPTPLP